MYIDFWNYIKKVCVIEIRSFFINIRKLANVNIIVIRF